jgi:hypothetical protein
MRLDRRIARSSELEEYLTAERQSLIDEDFCPGSTGIFGPLLELTRSDRNGDEPRDYLATESPSVLFAGTSPPAMLTCRDCHFSTPPVFVTLLACGCRANVLGTSDATKDRKA